MRRIAQNCAAYWPSVPISPPKSPYASAFFAPIAYAASTDRPYRAASFCSAANDRTVRTDEKTSWAVSEAVASAFWYRCESDLTHLP